MKKCSARVSVYGTIMQMPVPCLTYRILTLIMVILSFHTSHINSSVLFPIPLARYVLRTRGTLHFPWLVQFS